MRKGIRFRIYPNDEQRKMINRTFGCYRLVFNKGLEMRDAAYEKGESINYYKTSAALTEMKKQEEYQFLNEVDAVALQQALRDLDQAFKNFYEKRASHPKYKNKRNHRQKYRSINTKNRIKIKDGHIRIPKVGYIKMKQSREIGIIKSITIERTPSEKYFVIINSEYGKSNMDNNGGEIGIDVGIKKFYTDSNGNTVDNPKYLEKSISKIKRIQRHLDRKKYGSSNYNKQRIRLAKTYEKVVNQRNDFLQKQSTMLIKENQIICIEDINIERLLHQRKHGLSKHIASISWGKFFTMLEYKAMWYGNKIIRIPTTYPSSQICSNCGYQNRLLKNVDVRQWECPKCHVIHDRDVNAAINILNKGLSMA